MDALHVQLELFLTGGTYHAATCRYGSYDHPDQPLYPARIVTFSLSSALPDLLTGGLAKRSASFTLSDQDLGRLDAPTLAAILATENPKGKRATVRLWDPVTATTTFTLNGVISSLGQDYRTLTIEGDETTLGQQMLPTSRALDHYPSLDTAQMESKDPPPIVVFGPMPRVTLGLAVATSLTFTATMGGPDADKYVYADLTAVPNYTVAAGDRLVYDLHHSGVGPRQAIDLRCSDGTLLRTSGAVDQNGLSSAPGTDLEAYTNSRWYRREIELTPLVGKTITEYLLGGENDTTDAYTANLAFAYILDASDTKKAVIFDETILTTPIAYYSRNNTATTATATPSRFWYYGPIRLAATGTVSVKAVYVDGRVREAAAYAVVSANGWLWVRFTARPLDAQGRPAKVQADLDSTEFARNPATVCQFLWADATMLNQTVDAASFTAAAAVYAGIGDYLKVVGGLAERKSALQLVRDLSFRSAYFDRTAAGAVTMIVDAASQHPAAPVDLGENDDRWRNAELVTNNSLSHAIADQPRQLDFLAYRDPGLGASGQASFLISATRSRVIAGATVTRESPYCGAGKMADREAGYLFKALVAQDLDIEVRTGATTGQQLALGQLVKFSSPRHYFSGTQLVIRRLKFDGGTFTLGLVGWDPTLFTYTPGKVTVSRLVDAFIDYTQTTPSTPTSPIHVSSTVTIGDDGAALVIEKFRVTLPSVNCTELRIFLYRNGTGQASPFQTGSKTVIVLGGTNDIEVEVPVRMVYDIEFYAYNGANHPDHRYSLPALITGRLAASDGTAPAVPTGLAATVGTGQVVSLDWNNNPELDFGEYRVYRGATNPPTTLIAEVRASRFIDVSVVIGTLYYYAISALDRTENESAKCTAVSATPVLIPGNQTSTTVPNTPSAPTFNAEGTYFSADGTSVAYIEVTAPAMPTNGVVMNVLYQPNGATAWSIADQVSAGSVVSRVDDLISGRAYQFAVQAFSVFGRGSAVSAVLARSAPFDTTAPAAPVLLDCVPFNQRAILLDWQDNTETDFSEYAVYRQSFTNLVNNYGFEEFEFAGWTKFGTPGSGELFGQSGVHSGARAANIVSSGTTLLLYQDIPVSNGATYTLAGWAVATAWTAGTAALRVDTGNGTYVYALILVAVGGWTFGSVTFTATGTTARVECRVATTGNVTAYFDDIALFAGAPNPTTKIAEVRASRYTDSGFFLAGTVYYYAISALDRTENESAKSNLFMATPIRISNEDLSKYTPQALGTLSISSSGTYQSSDGTTLAYVVLAWTNPTDANRAYVEIAYRRSGNTASYLIGDQVTGTTARIDDLTPGAAYDYRVRGVSQVGTFGAASTLAAQTAPGDTTAPAQVTGLALSDHPPRGILARWTAVAADDLANYEVQSATDSGFTASVVTRTAKTTELPLTALTNGTTYFVRVRAVDLTGNAGSYSATVSRTVPRTGTDDNDDNSITTAKRVVVSTQSVATGNMAAGVHTHTENTAASYTQNATTANSSALFPGTAGLILTHNLGKKVTATAYTSNGLIIMVVTANGTNSVSITGYNSGTTTQSGTISIDYW